jgi:hypothetical protein
MRRERASDPHRTAPHRTEEDALERRLSRLGLGPEDRDDHQLPAHPDPRRVSGVVAMRRSRAGRRLTTPRKGQQVADD